MYKDVKTLTKNIGSAGSQVKVGEIAKIDNVGATGYVNNLTISAIVNDYTSSETPGLIFYVGTSSSWSDDDVVVARAVSGTSSGTVNLPIKRRIAQNSEGDPGSNDGRLYVWAECTDVAITDDTEIRFVGELWGKFVKWV